MLRKFTEYHKCILCVIGQDTKVILNKSRPRIGVSARKDVCYKHKKMIKWPSTIGDYIK